MSIKTKISIIVLIALAFIAAGFYFGYQKYYLPRMQEKVSKPAEEIQTPAQKPAEPGTEKSPAAEIKPIPKTATILAGYKLYKNAEFHFEIQYPETWQVSEEPIENVRGEQTKGFFFKKPGSDLRFAILPRDGLSYSLPEMGTSSDVMVGGSVGSQTQFNLTDGRRLWLLHPNYGLYDWSQDIGRIDAMTGVENPADDIKIFEKMLNTFKLKY